MLKNILIVFLLFTANIVYAGSYEDALKNNDKVLLYFYTPYCSTCKAFDTTFDSLKSKKMGYGYVKINVDTPYGTHLFLKFKGRYVPFIILSDSKTKKSVTVNHTCVMSDVCLMRAMKSFNG